MTEQEYLDWFDNKELGFEMFTKAGNRKAKSITKKLIKKVFSKRRITMEDVQELAGKLIAKAYLNEKTSEIRDSEPPYHIWYYTNKAVKIAGYDWDWDTYALESKVGDWVTKLKEEAVV
jgi:hypothetical protein